MIFSGKSDIFAEPARSGERICIVFGLEFYFYKHKRSKIAFEDIKLCGEAGRKRYLDKKIVWSEITNDGSLKIPVYKLIIFILKYIAPIAISLIFINELGLIKL